MKSGQLLPWRTAAQARGRAFISGLSVVAVMSVPVSFAHGWTLATNLTLKAELTLKETFDSNVYLQDVEPAASVTNAVRPFQESFVTSVTPKLALDWKPLGGFNIAASYAPEVTRYHSEPGENHESHRAALSLYGKVREVSWEQFNTLNYIDGSREGLTFGGPGGAPAIGGIAIRDRREALIYRNGFRAFHPRGDWFFRPVAWSYVHDFRTKQLPRSQYPFYQNYLDRNDFTVGLDTGYKILDEAYILLGYRYGMQDEESLPGENIHYSNHYHRLVVGLEGRIFGWLKINGAIGPDWRYFDHETVVGFDTRYVDLYYDFAITVAPTKADTVAILLRRFEQPAFGAPSVYADITWEVTWRHRFTDRLTASAGFRTYVGDWLAPVQREDWIYTPSAGLSYVHDRHWSGELAYSYDWTDSKVPNTSGREYTRHLVALGLRYAF